MDAQQLRRKKEMDDLKAEIDKMEANEEEDFDEAAAQKELALKMRKEQQELQQMQMRTNQLLEKQGMSAPQSNPQQGQQPRPQQGQQPKAQQGQQPKQQQVQAQQKQQQVTSSAASKSAAQTEALRKEIESMEGCEDEEFDDKEEEKKFKQRMAKEEAEFKQLTKQSDFLTNQVSGGDDGGMEVETDDQGNQDFDFMGTQKSPQEIRAAKEKKMKQLSAKIIERDRTYSSLADLVSIALLEQEYLLCVKNIQNSQANAELCSYFTEKKIAIEANVSKIGQLFFQGKLSVEKYSSMLESSVKKQEQLKVQVKETKEQGILPILTSRIAQLKNDITGLKKDSSNYLKAMIKKGMVTMGLREAVQKEENPNDAMAKFFDGQTLQEKLEKLINNHYEMLNYTMFLKKNVPSKLIAVQEFYLPLLKKSKELMETMKSGQNIPIYSFLQNELKDVTQEYFNGCNISQFEANKMMWIDKLAQAIRSEADLQKMINATLKKKGGTSAEESQIREKKYGFQKNELEKLNFNSYQMFPTITTTSLKLDLSIDNKAIQKNEIVVIIKRLVNCKADKYQVTYSFQPESTVLTDTTDWCDVSLVFNREKKYLMTKNKYPDDLASKFIQVIIYVKGFFSNSEFARVNIPLAPLSSTNTIDDAITMTSKGKQFQLEYGIFTRNPISGAANKEISVYNLEFYPPFNPREGVEEAIKKNLAEVKIPVQQPPQPKPEPQPQQKQQVQEKEPNKQQHQQQDHQDKTQHNPKNSEDIEKVQPKENPKMEVEQPAQKEEQAPQEQQEEQQPQQPNLLLGKFVNREVTDESVQALRNFEPLPEGISVMDLIDLECPTRYKCMPYLINGFDAIADAIATSEYTAKKRREVSKIRDKFLEIRTIFESDFENNNIDPEEYKISMIKMIDQDNKVLWVYQKLGLTQWAEFVKARAEIVKKDFFDNFELKYDPAPYSQ